MPNNNPCSVQDCVLPGGHFGPHKDAASKTFSWTQQGGRIDLEGDPEDEDQPTELFSSSDESASSDELLPDEQLQAERPPPKRKLDTGDEMSFYALEIDVSEEDQQYFMRHPRKLNIWLSKKMQEKSKEHKWSELSLDRKKDFDVAQAQELTNVMQSKALRSLTKDEHLRLNPRRCMQMRWVLTTKSSGQAKARWSSWAFNSQT